MRILLTSVFVFFISAIVVAAQNPQKPALNEKAKLTAVTNSSNAAEIAKSAFAAHGGDKLKALKTLIIKGSVDVTTSAFNQVIPGAFSIVISGEKYILDIQNAMQSLKQTYNGKETMSTVSGFLLPPVTSQGFPLLLKLGSDGYTVSSLPETSKKKLGFRMTAPNGEYTDFYVDEKTNQIKGFESAFELNGRIITTSAEIDKFRTIDGIVLPEKYAQRFDLGQLTAYGDFKAKEILVNSEISDDLFTINK